MGHDQHGPAYPEPPRYSCPVCGWDAKAYLRCNHPGCPDGRDRCHPHSRSRIEPGDPWLDHAIGPRRVNYPLRITVVAVLAAVFWLFWPVRAPAMNHGFNPDAPLTKWMESKIRPDSPPNPCCGKADAYPVARYQRNSDHTWTVWLADGSALKYPDGTTRDYFDMSTPIIVPDNKVNAPDDDLDNPTDVGWVFMRVASPTEVGAVYCLIVHPEGN